MSVPNQVPSQRPPTEAERRRLARERALLAHARESVARGHVVPDSELDAWLAGMVDGDEPLPIPSTDRPLSDRS